MARQVGAARGQAFHYGQVTIYKDQQLGHGAYGAVYKAKYGHLPCAAKVLHPTIVDPHDPGSGRIMERFQQECDFLSGIRHPNIVQYLGVCSDPESKLPVLLMELMDESLTKMLERSQLPISYYVQVDLCHDISLAVAFLHSNKILHRDLSGNNVLVVAGKRAKVTDFGMSKFNVGQHMTPLTMCPGTLAYMSPEALKEPPQYTAKLDVFSQGVIVIQVCSRQFPNPGPARREVEDPRYPGGSVEVRVPERERRNEHIDLIDPHNPLLAIAMDCIEYRERDRPTASQLCERLARLKEQPQYISSEQHEEEGAAEKERMIREFQQEREGMMEQIEGKDRQIEEKSNQIALISRENALKIEKKNEVITVMKKEMIRKDDTISTRNKEIEKLQIQLKEKEVELDALMQRIEDNQHVIARFQKYRQIGKLTLTQQKLFELNWVKRETAPFRIFKWTTTVADGDIVYVPTASNQIHSYDTRLQVWSPLPPCPNNVEYGGLAIIQNLLTIIGGLEKNSLVYTNQLISYSKEKQKWGERFPCMPTARFFPSTIAHHKHLIVAGGSTQLTVSNITTVEVLNTDTMVWSTAASLPYPCRYFSVAICGDRLYMLGGDEHDSSSLSVLTCELSELLQEPDTESLVSSLKRRFRLRSSSLSSHDQVWERAADIPVCYSTCVSVRGELVAVGGQDESNNPTTAMYWYNKATNEWIAINHMSTARFGCHVAVVQDTKEIIIVGGFTDQNRTTTNAIERAVIST